MKEGKPIRKKFILDALLNIIAYAIPVIILQLIAFPIIGRELGNNQYGLVVTLVSLYTLLSLPFGNVLNNVRLLQNKDYESNGIKGDFNVLLAWSIVLSSLILMLGTIYYEGNFTFSSIALIVVISCLNLLREYLIVSFRINLNYKAILINNAILGFGYVIGIAVFYITGLWQMILIIGSGLSLIYITRNTNLLREGFTVTSLFKKIAYKSFVLFISVFLKNVLSYADKLLLFPLLGPTAVSIYYTATILGKIIAIMITPINSVMLSYLSKTEKISLKYFFSIFGLTGIIGGIGYLVTILISYRILSFLYPNWAADSMELIYITTASAILEVVASVLHPFLLRFSNINWQYLISGSNLIVYVLGATIFFNLYGLIGFCIGILVTNVFKLGLMIVIFIINYRNDSVRKIVREAAESV
ncbi:lipopolysaccharide biosynthesis protein [Paenibacillus albus]|uniref:Flippase n=1 Tax=Paenibacillus albus TaxID=2495582 RepID=A0A3Q8X1V2_9BACL|nr:hypothetical protein [Paenibacillus albus]AZN38582.1 hypothetical protein EJC50_02000 [Paenibacillus albus]